MSRRDFFIFNVSLGSAPKRKKFDIQRNTRVGLGCQFTSNRLSCHRMYDETLSIGDNVEGGGDNNYDDCEV